MTEDFEQRGDAARRRRGTRGGRGRGARTEAEPTRPATNIDEPRIVGRRPGRPATTVAPSTEIKVVPPAQPAQPARRPAAAATTKVEEEAPATRRPARRTSASAASADGNTEGLAAVIEALRAEVQSLAERVERSARRPRLGVFVDVPNLLYGAEYADRLDMGKLLAHLSEDRELIRATAYAPVSDNPMEPVQQQRFVAPFVPHEYRIVTKPLKRFQDGSIKGNFDVEMAVDMLSMVDRLDVMAIVSGDADFARVVEEAQSRGVRVEVIAFSGSTSAEMRALADRYIDVGAITHLLR
jgi:uncharacterized LabA/DUF88 family protein